MDHKKLEKQTLRAYAVYNKSPNFEYLIKFDEFYLIGNSEEEFRFEWDSKLIICTSAKVKQDHLEITLNTGEKYCFCNWKVEEV